MGGHSFGQVASELALKTMVRTYYADPTLDTVTSLKRAFADANSLIYDTAQIMPDRKDMGTTVTTVVIRENKAVFAHAGDSRAYLIREGEIEQVTYDHSWVAEHVRLGTMTLEEAQLSPLRNVITRSIGTQPTAEPDFFLGDIQAGDIIILCTDGLTGHVDPDELFELAGSDAARRLGPSVSASRLVELAISRGGRDNITVMIIDIASIDDYPEAPSAQ